MSKKVEIPIDVFKVFVRFNFPATPRMFEAIAKQRNNKVLLLPSDTTIIIVDDKGKVTKY